MDYCYFSDNVEIFEIRTEVMPVPPDKWIGTPEGVREICKNLKVTEVPTDDMDDDLEYGFGQVVAGTNKYEWDGTEKIFGLAKKVNEEFAAVNIALRTNVDLDTIEVVRKIAEDDLKRLSMADSSLKVTTSGTVILNQGTIRKYNYHSWDPDNNPLYMSPEIGSG